MPKSGKVYQAGAHSGGRYQKSRRSNSNRLLETRPVLYGTGLAKREAAALGIHLMAYRLNNSRRTIAVDFDGVIAEYHNHKGPGVLAETPEESVARILAKLEWMGLVESTPEPAYTADEARLAWLGYI